MVKHGRSWLSVAALAALVMGGCGDDFRQRFDAMAVVVPDGGDAGEGGARDARDAADATSDAARERADAVVEAREDARADASAEAPADTRPDVTVDAGADVPGSPDAADAAREVAADVTPPPPDAAADASTDVATGADAPVDAPADAAHDAASEEVAPSCTDGTKNGGETDTDCGGGTCGACGPAKRCVVATDCASGACNAAGICVECLTATTCPGVDGDCAHRTCVNGACGVDRATAGTPLPGQTAGDCKVNRCDGAGNAVVANDDDDVPDDHDPCTADLCASGAGSHQPRPERFACGGGRLCDVAGRCVDCLAATDCTEPDSICQARACTAAGTCRTDNLASGTPLPTQTAGDCKVNQCDGNGNTVVANDDGDVLDDGDPCTADLCTAGTASHLPRGAGFACGGGNQCDGAGHCVQCLAATDCPGEDNACQSRACTPAGVCQLARAPSGTRTLAQAGGDCKVVECDGNGQTVSVTDDSDLPVDDNVCTADLCTGGVSSNPHLPPNTPCGGGNRCDGAGHCVACLAATDCPGQDGVCQSRVCRADSTCGVNNVAPGTLAGTQTTGDCQVSQCDGQGALSTVADDADRPDDGNPCTLDLCTNGVASHAFVDPGAACGAAGMCDGAGHCVQCLADLDCGPSSACQSRTCGADHVCATVNAGPATVIGAQVAGDCSVLTCDGAGNIVPAVDDTDLPDDHNACTADACTLGTPSSTPVSLGIGCGGTDFCDGFGQCVGCLADSDCGGSFACEIHACGSDHQCTTTLPNAGTRIAAQVAGDCNAQECDGTGRVVTVIDDTDVRVDGKTCTADLCVAGTPANPVLPSGTTCGGTNICDGSGVCFNGTRPQLPAAEAPNFTILKYLEKTGSLVNGLTTDNWGATAVAGVGDVATFTPRFVVQKGTAFPTVQSALDAALALGAAAPRVFIQVVADTYREVACVRNGSPPITLYGTSPNAADTVIVFDNWAGRSSTVQPVTSNPCALPGGTTFGTSATATMAVFARDFQAKNLTFANDIDELTLGTTNNLQAVALEAQGDRHIFENVRLLGNQDTLYVKSGNIDTVTRAYFKGCYLEGDVDAIFGRATWVMDGCEIKYVSNRRGPTNGGDLVSPSTDRRNAYGLLVINSQFTADANTAANTVALGRAWDEGFNALAAGAPYPPVGTVNYPNAQVLIRDSVLGPHIRSAAPWVAAASTNRPYSFTGTALLPANRLFELNNTGPGAAAPGP